MSDQVTNQLPDPPREPTCPECGAAVRDPRATRCWMCREPLRPGEYDEDNPYRLPPQHEDNPAWAVFGVLAVLIVAGLAIETPGVLFVLLALAVPACIRMVVVGTRRRAAGQPQTAGGAMLAFLTSLGVTALVGVAAFAAFFATCFAVCLGGVALVDGRGRGLDGLLIAAVGLGTVVAAGVFAVLIYVLSRSRK